MGDEIPGGGRGRYSWWGMRSQEVGEEGGTPGGEEGGTPGGEEGGTPGGG